MEREQHQLWVRMKNKSIILLNMYSLMFGFLYCIAILTFDLVFEYNKIIALWSALELIAFITIVYYLKIYTTLYIFDRL